MGLFKKSKAEQDNKQPEDRFLESPSAFANDPEVTEKQEFTKAKVGEVVYSQNPEEIGQQMDLQKALKEVEQKRALFLEATNDETLDPETRQKAVDAARESFLSSVAIANTYLEEIAKQKGKKGVTELRAQRVSSWLNVIPTFFKDTLMIVPRVLGGALPAIAGEWRAQSEKADQRLKKIEAKRFKN